MKNLLSLTWLLAVFLPLLVGPSAQARSNELKLTNFSIGAIRYILANRDTDSHIDVSWTPVFEWESIGFRLGLGANPVRTTDTKRVLALNYEAYVLVPVASIFGFEAGGGLRTIFDSSTYGGTHPELGIGFIARTGEFFDRLYISYSKLFITDNTTSILRVGTAFNL